MKSLSKIKSEVKYARLERKLLINHSKYHKITVNRYHRADRKQSKLTLKQHLG